MFLFEEDVQEVIDDDEDEKEPMEEDENDDAEQYDDNVGEIQRNITEEEGTLVICLSFFQFNVVSLNNS